MDKAEHTPPVAACGIAGLDDILRGGFPRDCLFLVSGTPGTGKTTLAMQFLLEGVRQGERCLYVTLSETRAEIAKVARSMPGISRTFTSPSSCPPSKICLRIHS